MSETAQRRCDDCKSHDNYVGRIMKLEEHCNRQLGDSNQVLIHIEYLRKEVAEMRKDLDDNFVSKDEFYPVRMIAFGMITLVMTGIIGAVITMMIKGTK